MDLVMEWFVQKFLDLLYFVMLGLLRKNLVKDIILSKGNSTTYPQKFGAWLTASSTSTKLIESSTTTTTECTDTSECTSFCLWSYLNQFCRNRPPTFHGNVDPLVVEKWIRYLDCIFWYITCIDAQKVQCIKFMFVGSICCWWESTSRTRTKEQ